MLPNIHIIKSLIYLLHSPNLQRTQQFFKITSAMIFSFRSETNCVDKGKETHVTETNAYLQSPDIEAFKSEKSEQAPNSDANLLLSLRFPINSRAPLHPPRAQHTNVLFNTPLLTR